MMWSLLLLILESNFEGKETVWMEFFGNTVFLCVKIVL